MRFFSLSFILFLYHLSVLGPHMFMDLPLACDMGIYYLCSVHHCIAGIWACMTSQVARIGVELHSIFVRSNCHRTDYSGYVPLTQRMMVWQQLFHTLGRWCLSSYIFGRFAIMGYAYYFMAHEKILGYADLERHPVEEKNYEVTAYPSEVAGPGWDKCYESVSIINWWT